MRILIIRHAESQENVRNMREKITIDAFHQLIRDSHSSELTLAGEEQLRTLQAELANRPLTHVYASPFLRAQRTAAAVAQINQRAVVTVDDLHEILPARPFVFRRQGQRSLGLTYIRGFLQLMLPSTRYETMRQARQRVQRTWTALSAEWDTQSTVAIISHRAFISTLLRQLERSAAWKVLKRDVRNTGISEVVPAGS